MKKSNFYKLVPLKNKGVFKKKFLKKRMWYIGSIYRASKGQYMHNKFINNFFKIHLKFLTRFSMSTRSRIFYKLFNQMFFLTSIFKIYGNIEKFESKYYNTEIDSYFFNLPKFYESSTNLNTLIPTHQYIISSGVTYFPIYGPFTSGLELQLTEESEFFVKLVYSNFWDLSVLETTPGFDETFYNNYPCFFMYWTIQFYQSIINAHIYHIYLDLNSCTIN